MSHYKLDRFHCDPDNWKLGILYFCRADPRMIVPKRIRALGWTLNFARPLAVPFFGFICVLVLSLLDLIKTLWGAGGDARFDLETLLALGAIAIGYRFFNRRASK